MADFRPLPGKKAQLQGLAPVFKLKRYKNTYQFVAFTYRKTNTKT